MFHKTGPIVFFAMENLGVWEKFKNWEDCIAATRKFLVKVKKRKRVGKLWCGNLVCAATNFLNPLWIIRVIFFSTVENPQKCTHPNCIPARRYSLGPLPGGRHRTQYKKMQTYFQHFSTTCSLVSTNPTVHSLVPPSQQKWTFCQGFTWTPLALKSTFYQPLRWNCEFVCLSSSSPLIPFTTLFWRLPRLR